MSITLFYKEEGIHGKACDHDFVTRKEARTTVDLCSGVTVSPRTKAVGHGTRSGFCLGPGLILDRRTLNES